MTGSNKYASSYRIGMAVAGLAALLTVWTTIVRDNGTGSGYFMLILAAGVGGIAALFEAAGMARAMAGVAVMQALLGILIATAPVIANQPGLSLKVLLFNAAFCSLWLVSAGFFRSAARAGGGRVGANCRRPAPIKTAIRADEPAKTAVPRTPPT